MLILLALEPGDIARDRWTTSSTVSPSSQMRRWVRTNPSMDCTPRFCSLLLAPLILKQGVRLLLPIRRVFQFGQILHGDQDANARAVGMDLRDQHQTTLFTQRMAAFSGSPVRTTAANCSCTGACPTTAQTVAAEAPGLRTSTQPLRRRCSVGGDQAQFEPC